MSAVSDDFRRLVALSSPQRHALMRGGQTPEVESLVGTEYHGANTARWTGVLGMRQFVKGFARRADGRVLGYNRRVAQDGLEGDWGSPSEAFAFFEVREVDPAARDNRYLRALLLDYGAGGNPRLDPSGLIRDYLVRVRPGSDDLLLGRATLVWGPLRPSPTDFVLERARKGSSPPGR